MYNKNIKQEFINGNDYAEKTKVLLTNSFSNCENYEQKLGKDIYEMNINELEGLLKYVGHRTISRVIGLVSNIKVYSRWAYDKGYSQKPDSAFEHILSSDYYANFVSNTDVFYLTRNELLNYLEQTPDNSVKACMLAVFEGIGGRGYQELSNIRISDIFQNGEQWYVNLRNDLDGTIRRKHPISNELKDYLFKANEATTFKGMNGRIKYSLIDSDYVFKYFISRRNVGMQKILLGSKSDAKLYETYLRYFRDGFNILKMGKKFSLKEVKYSGMMHYLNEALMTQDDANLITGDTVDKIAERYIFPTQHVEDKEYIVYSKIKTMVASDFMNEVYGKNIEYDFSRESRVKQS